MLERGIALVLTADQGMRAARIQTLGPAETMSSLSA